MKRHTTTPSTNWMARLSHLPINWRALAAGLAVLVVVGAGVQGFMWYRQSVAQETQVHLARLLEFYQASLSNTNPQAWVETVQVAQEARNNAWRTPTAAYADAIQADALVRQGLYAEAAVLQEQAVAAMPHSALAQLHELKAALLDCDSGDSARVAQGEQALARIAQSPNHAGYYAAQFYQGLFAFVTSGELSARTAWSGLLQAADSELGAVAWRERARSYLEYRPVQG